MNLHNRDATEHLNLFLFYILFIILAATTSLVLKVELGS